MKHRICFLLLCLAHSNSRVYSSASSAAPTQLASAAVPLDAPDSQAVKMRENLGKIALVSNNLPTYPRHIVRMTTDESGTPATQLTHVILNRKARTTVTGKMLHAARSSQATVLAPGKADRQVFYKNYPTGATIFPHHATLAKKFDNLISFLQKDMSESQGQFLKFFRKIHMNILNELYNYLMKIYTTLNLRHVGSKQTDEGLVVSLPEYLADEKTYATNKKTLIVNHLTNLIEAQLNSSILGIVPKMPHYAATHVGKTLIQSDFSTDLTRFIIADSPGIESLNQTYRAALALYLDFFQTFTAFLAEKDTTSGFNTYVTMAQDINTYLYKDGPNSALTKMNPPMFFYDKDSMRAMQLIPALAQTLPQGSQSITWPEKVVDDAKTSYMVDGHITAFFSDKNNSPLVDPSMSGSQREALGVTLHIVIGSGKNLYSQELLAQPDWLNTESGILAILQGCLGNFEALLELNILDPCTQAVIEQAYATLKGKPVAKDSPACQACKTFVEQIKTFNNQQKTIAQLTNAPKKQTSPKTPPTSSSEKQTTSKTPEAVPSTKAAPTLPSIPSTASPSSGLPPINIPVQPQKTPAVSLPQKNPPAVSQPAAPQLPALPEIQAIQGQKTFAGSLPAGLPPLDAQLSDQSTIIEVPQDGSTTPAISLPTSLPGV